MRRKWGMTAGGWISASCQFGTTSIQADHLSIRISNTGAAQTGTMYLDNVQVN
jgi:hypothetical protein